MDNDRPLYRLAADPASLPTDELRKLAADYPYSSLPALALLNYHIDDLTENDLNQLRTHLAVISGDKDALYRIIGERHNEFAALYPQPDDRRQTDTDNAIDTFFANYGSADPAETELLERMIFNPVPDYAELLLREEGIDDSDDPFPIHLGPSHHDAEADKELRQAAAPADANQDQKAVAGKPADKSALPPADDTLLSESLAKIFIKQGRYERAYEIISNLSLNYPKKSIYFADQLRFLQKLIKIKQAANGR